LVKQRVDEKIWYHLNVVRLDHFLLKCFDMKYRIKFNTFEQSNNIDKMIKKEIGKATLDETVSR
jgi:hypothetical protein